MFEHRSNINQVTKEPTDVSAETLAAVNMQLFFVNLNSVSILTNIVLSLYPTQVKPTQ